MNKISATTASNFSRFSFRHDFLKILVIAVAYFFAHRVAFLFPDSRNVIMIVWPASGIGFAAFLLNPRRLWPVLTLAFYAAGILSDVIMSDGSLFAGVGTMTASMIQSIGCALLILYISRDFKKFSQLKEILALLVGAVLINAFTACIGAGIALIVRRAPFIQSWQAWYISDGLGILLVGPFIVCWISNVKDSITGLRLIKMIEGVAFILIWSIISYIIFYQPDQTFFVGFRPYMLVALVAYPAVRFGMKGVTMALMILLIIAIGSSEIFNLPSPWFKTQADVFLRLISLQIFMLFLAFVGYLISAFYSDLKRAEGLLRKSEEQYRTIIEAALDGFWMADTNGRLLMVNNAYCKMTGYTKSELLNMNVSDLEAIESPADTAARIQQLISNGEDRFETRHRRKDGSFIDLEIDLQYRLDEGGKFVVFLHDITERKQAELELIAAKEKAESANNLKDAFIANISHEIRTPLNGILGMSGLIKDLFIGSVTKEDEVLFEGVDYSSKRLIRTVDMILNYSRIQVGTFPVYLEKLNLPSVCATLIKEYILTAKMKSLELSFQNNCEDTTVFADEYSITMAVSNLIDNAIKYTKEGSVTVILHKGKNDDLILDVKDTGIGISQEYLEHIFEPFRQEEMGYGRAYEGIGLGLAIVNKVLKLNNCVISVESKKGEGATFSINFGKGEQPFENKSKTGVVFNILPAPEELRKEVVLLVEDDLMNQVTIERFIENSYSVIVTDSSDEAMDIIKKEKVDIILMDISIKGSRNGLELTKELKASKEFSHIPVIAVTAHAFEEDRQASLKAGCDSYLAKPFTKQSLLEMIKIFVNKPIVT